MKVRIDFTIDVDADVIRRLISDHYESDETLKEFLVSFCSSDAAFILDQHVNNSIGSLLGGNTHRTEVVRVAV